MSITLMRFVVLYADVSGSTRLYEKFGDSVALADIKTCVDILSEVTEKYGGKVIKTIGDEVMSKFQRPDKAAEAACEMQQAIRDASEEGEFQSGELHIKIGWHFGGGSQRKDDIIGEAPTLAQQAIKMAKPDEILTTKQCIDQLPTAVKLTGVFIDKVEADDGSGSVEIYSLPWNLDDVESTEITAEAEIHETGGVVHSAVILHYGNQQYEMNPENPRYQVGRGDDNELVVRGAFTSRHHAEIYYRHGRFHLADMSTNGTCLLQNGSEIQRLHREETLLSGSGVIYFGGDTENDPDSEVRFECVE